MKSSLSVALATLTLAASCVAQSPDSIRKEIGGLRALPEAERGARTGAIAKEIAALPNGKEKLGVADGLAHLATEGDPGHDNLQAVTAALSAALQGNPVPAPKPGAAAEPYSELATLARYEDMKVPGTITDDPQFKAASAVLEKQDADTEKADFTLKDIHNKKWTKSELKGKILLLNFWATWCPPCRVELPNLNVIADHYASQGLVVLAVTDEDAIKVSGLLDADKVHFHILFDPGRKTAEAFHVNSLPRTLVFDRDGKLAAAAMDGRTQKQFLLMLKKAGLQL